MSTVFARVLIAGLSLATLPSAASAAAPRPTILAPTTAGAGERIVMTATSSRARQTCQLRLVSPGGLTSRYTLRRLSPRGRGVRATISKRAQQGNWEIVLACGGKTSSPTVLNLTSDAATSSGRFASSVRVFTFPTALPPGLAARNGNQDGDGAPTFSPVELDGLGAATGDRSAGALKWALERAGSKDYALWCLRFVANAYNAQKSGFRTAQEAAERLGLRNSGGSAASAPAGALLFFRYIGADGANYGHVGLSLGNGRMISALTTVKIETIDQVKYWRENYLGWAFPPPEWPGFPPPAPPTITPITPIVTPTSPPAQPTPAPTSAPAPAPAPPRRVITVDNRVTNGNVMREDPTPARLQTRAEIYCGTKGCNIGGTERVTGQTYDAAVCQTQGQRTTNGNDGSSVDDANPERFESTRYYGVRLSNGTYGVISEVWIRAADRGGLGLPAC